MYAMFLRLSADCVCFLRSAFGSAVHALVCRMNGQAHREGDRGTADRGQRTEDSGRRSLLPCVLAKLLTHKTLHLYTLHSTLCILSRLNLKNGANNGRMCGWIFTFTYICFFAKLQRMQGCEGWVGMYMGTHLDEEGPVQVGDAHGVIGAIVVAIVASIRSHPHSGGLCILLYPFDFIIFQSLFFCFEEAVPRRESWLMFLDLCTHSVGVSLIRIPVLVRANSCSAFLLFVCQPAEGLKIGRSTCTCAPPRCTTKKKIYWLPKISWRSHSTVQPATVMGSGHPE